MYIVHMDELGFVWDEKKNLANQRKHGVSFEEAQTAFYDENATVYFDTAIPGADFGKNPFARHYAIADDFFYLTTVMAFFTYMGNTQLDIITDLPIDSSASLDSITTTSKPFLTPALLRV